MRLGRDGPHVLAQVVRRRHALEAPLTIAFRCGPGSRESPDPGRLLRPRGGGNEQDKRDDDETSAQSSKPPLRYAYAAPTMILRMRSHGEPCEMLLIWVGCPFASPLVPNICHDSLPEMASRWPQKSVVIAL